MISESEVCTDNWHHVVVRLVGVARDLVWESRVHDIHRLAHRRVWGALAPARRRRRRVQRKIDKRGGYLRHRCAGSMLASLLGGAS